MYLTGRGGSAGGRGGQRRNQGWVDYEYDYDREPRRSAPPERTNRVRI